MALLKRYRTGRAFLAAGACVLSLLLTLDAAQAQDKTYTMKITLATINDQIHAFVRNYAAALEKASGGRIKPEIYPASQLGSIPRQTEGVQFGAIQCQVVPPEFLVGIDERFEVMAAPGLVTSMAQGQRLAADPAVLKLMLSLGAEKGLHGAGLFMVNPSAIAAKTPIRHLADFKGKKIRIFASQFQSVAFDRLGATPVAMSLGDVLPALQQGAIDGALASVPAFTPLHFYEAVKYMTETSQYYVLIVAELSKKWFDALPPDLQKIVLEECDSAARDAVAWQANEIANEKKTWTDHGGELIELPPADEAELMRRMSTIADDVGAKRPAIKEMYDQLKAAVDRNK
jgi:TRAP-type C4-dicarboxylate transport system substrate-binding protein